MWRRHVTLCIAQKRCESVSSQHHKNAMLAQRKGGTSRHLTAVVCRKVFQVEHMPLASTSDQLCRSLSIAARSTTPVAALVADGWTGHIGRVTGCANFGVFVDFGCERPGLIPAHGSMAEDPKDLAALQIGDEVVVYITSVALDTGKINLSLTPQEEPRIRWREIIADARTPYKGLVANIASFGAFVDIGTELQALLPSNCVREGTIDGLQRGQALTVYIREKRRDGKKLVCSLEPAPRSRKAWDDLIADGQTPYCGIVTSIDRKIGVFIDIGFEATVMLPIRDAMEVIDRPPLQPGDQVVVYIVQKLQHSGKISVSLHPRIRPLISFNDVVVDGQTPHQGIIVGKTDFGAFVDISSESLGLLPARETAGWQSLEIGDHVVVYAHTRNRDTGKITVSLRPSSKPRESWDSIICDGQRPYPGTVIAVNWYGVFIDIGCECHGRLMVPSSSSESDARVSSLKVGEQVTTYVIEKRPDSGKIVLSLDQRTEPLQSWKDLVADGQTAYKGIVLKKTDMGLWVDIGCDRHGLIRRRGQATAEICELDVLSIGDEIDIYVFRRNCKNGRLTLALHPSDARRLSTDEVLQNMGVATYLASVYSVQYEWAYLDFGCEASGRLARVSASSSLAAGSSLLVKPVSFSSETGRFEVVRARPPPPPKNGIDRTINGS